MVQATRWPLASALPEGESVAGRVGRDERPGHGVWGGLEEGLLDAHVVVEPLQVPQVRGGGEDRRRVR